MAGFAHLGVGMAAKRIAPRIPVGVLVAAAYAIDIVWAGFWAAGIERFPAPGAVTTAPWSHGLLMSAVWSVAAGLITLLISRNRRTSLVIGLLVFSHWVVDFIAKPMTHAFPADVGLPILFSGSPTVGLGVWRTAVGEYIGEYGTVILGIVVYLLTRIKRVHPANWERWGAATGYLVLALGVAAASFERGAPLANAPVQEIVAFFARYRSELLSQSLLFVLSAGVYLWFFGSLRSFMLRVEGETDRLATVVFGAGIVWAGIQMVFQSGQVTLAMAASGNLEPMLVGMINNLIYAMSVIAYVPMAVMLTAVAAASFRNGAFPSWVGWLSAITAAANLLMSFGIVANSGLLVPGGAMTYVLYALTVAWLAAVTTCMVVRLGKARPVRL